MLKTLTVSKKLLTQLNSQHKKIFLIELFGGKFFLLVVKWIACIEAMKNFGAKTFIECLNVEDLDSFKKTLDAIKQSA